MSKGTTRRTGAGMVRYAVFLRPDQLAALRAAQERSGVPAAEQIRRALDAALGTKPARKRGRA